MPPASRESGAIRYESLPRRAFDARLALRLDTCPSSGAEELPVVLAIGPLRVIGDVITKPRPNSEDALRLAGEFVDIDAFESRVTSGIVELIPR